MFGWAPVKPVGDCPLSEAESLKVVVELKVELVEAAPPPLVAVPVTVRRELVAALLAALLQPLRADFDCRQIVISAFRWPPAFRRLSMSPSRVLAPHAHDDVAALSGRRRPATVVNGVRADAVDQVFG